MKNSNKNWEEQMKQILDEQEIVFEETDWKAAQALIQAANLHVPTEKKRRKGLGWFWTVLVGGILFGYMVGSGHFSTAKLVAKNEPFSQNKTTQKIEKENKMAVGALALAKESEPSAKVEVPIEQPKASPIQTTRIAESVNVIPVAQTNTIAISDENIAKEAAKHDAFMAQTGTILDNKQVKSICPRNPYSLQKLTLAQNDLPENTDKKLEINLLENKKTSSFFHKIAANVYAGAAYSQRPYLNSTFYGGINMGYQITTHLQVNVFANYSERKVHFVGTGNVNGFVGTSVDTSNADITNITTSNSITSNATLVTREDIYLRGARYIGGGIGVSFPFKRHVLFANTTYHYLLNTKSKYTVNIVDNQSLIYQDSKNITNFNSGIYKWDISLGLGYQYAISRKIQVQIALNKGLKDMSKDFFYKDDVKHRNFQVQTGLVYRLF